MKTRWIVGLMGVKGGVVFGAVRQTRKKSVRITERLEQANPVPEEVVKVWDPEEQQIWQAEYGAPDVPVPDLSEIAGTIRQAFEPTQGFEAAPISETALRMLAAYRHCIAEGITDREAANRAWGAYGGTVENYRRRASELRNLGLIRGERRSAQDPTTSMITRAGIDMLAEQVGL